MIVIKPPPYSENCPVMRAALTPLIESVQSLTHPDQINAIQITLDDYFDLHLRETRCQHCADTATIALSSGAYKPPTAT